MDEQFDLSNYKHCFNCDNVYRVEAFYANTARYDKLSVLCKSCHSADTANRMKLRREQVINLYGAKCAGCGYNADIRALQFDHVNSDGKDDRHSPSMNLKKIMQDDAGRYQLLCANCNVIKMDEAGERLKSKPSHEPIIGEQRTLVIEKISVPVVVS